MSKTLGETTSTAQRVEELLARYVEHHVVHGARLPLAELCRDRPELEEPLEECVRRYEALDLTLTRPSWQQETPATPQETEPEDEPLPSFAGFRTVERLGRGGGGEVFKVADLELGRTAAAKVIRTRGPLHTTLEHFLREARAQALFEDPRIVQVYEFRPLADPPVLIMEFVDGFELSQVGPSLEYPQRARVVAEIAEAIHRAHTLGLQHRDLKPANVLLDARLSPKILDFGLSQGDPKQGHGRGTPAYMAPEQLDARCPIDARTDVYALGVILYELLCGTVPYSGTSDDELVAAVRAGDPRLPVEIEPEVPEPLQAIALKAMDKDPAQRYATAREMALELRRYLQGRPVLARPSLYRSALERRLRPHLEQIREWTRIKLIYPHEAEGLAVAYQRLEAREDDWIVQSRTLSFSQVALYLGAFLLMLGSLFYFNAYLRQAVGGLLGPALALGLPFLGLNGAAHFLDRKGLKAVAVAYFLAAVLLLPLWLLVLFQETGAWEIDPESELEFFGEDFLSNRQLQVAGFLACLWSCWLALRTHTLALATGFTVLGMGFHFTVLTDFGLRLWLEDARYDLVALNLAPLLLVTSVLGFAMEAGKRPWFSRPLYLGSAGVYVAILELLALDGRMLGYLGVSMAPFQSPEVSDPELLDTCAALTLNGILIYTAGWLLERYGSRLMRASSRLLYLLSPFAILEPILYLTSVGEYSRRLAWLYLVLALAITFLSHYRQRKSFYYAGLLNTGSALWLITDHYEWWERPGWALVVGGIGLVVLAVGLGLDVHERNRRGAAA